MNTPKTRQQSAVNVSTLYANVYPKQITEREIFTAGPFAQLGLLTGVQSSLTTFTGLGKSPSTGINAVKAGECQALVNVDSAGGSITAGTTAVKVKTAAGVESSVAWVANGAEPALNTVLGVDTDVNGLQAGTIVEGSSFTNTWTLLVTRVDNTSATFVLKHTTPATDQQWNATVDVDFVLGDQATVFVGNPHALTYKHSAVTGSVAGAFVTASTLTADAILPVVSAFVIPATGTAYAVTVSTFTVTEAGGSVYRAITTSATAPAANASVWGAVGVTPSSYTIPVAEQVGSGTYTLYGWAKDGAGNVSLGVSDSIVLTIS